MQSRLLSRGLLLLLASLTAHAQSTELSKAVQEFVRVNSSKVVLAHVRIIDGTGAAAVDDQNVVIEGGKITAIQKGADLAADKSTAVLDLRGYTVMPGIVGVHNHLFYIARPNLDSRRHFDDPVVVPQMTFSAPRLYLANGVTTMRTTGSVEPYSDLNLKRDIDAGNLPGPHLDVTGPYLEGSESYFLQMPHLTGPDDARQTVEFWADRGVTSFKAYMNITRAELKARLMQRTSVASK
jgi:imidazolonepropionase-like amidohydrolase